MRSMIIAGLLAAGIAAPTFAYDQTTNANGDQVRVVPVSRTGVDFADQGQVGRLYAKLKRAADQACSTESADRHLARPDRACVAAALDQAVRGAGQPLLTATYQADSTAADRALAGNDQ
jgi:UrcA family protein